MTNSTRRALRALTKILFVIAVASSSAYSQAASIATATSEPSEIRPASDAPSYTLAEGTNEFGLWTGGSFASPTIIGTAQDRRYFTLGLRYGRVFAASKRVAYEYTLDVVPVAVVFQPDSARSFSRVDRAIYGAGVSPIGFKVNFNRRGKMKPFASGSAGFLYFKDPVPTDVPGATRFNFTFDFGGGVQIFTRSRKAVTLGYRFHHISNANRTRVNPGLDANIFYVGYSLFKRGSGN